MKKILLIIPLLFSLAFIGNYSLADDAITPSIESSNTNAPSVELEKKDIEQIVKASVEASEEKVDETISAGEPTDIVTAITEIAKLVSNTDFKSGKLYYIIPLLIVQILMILLRTPLAGRLGRWKYLTVLGVSFLTALLTGLLAGTGLIEILTSGTVISALSVLIHQAIKQFAKE